MLVLCGSTRRPSYTRAALDAFAACLEEEGAAVWRWDAAADPLPIADPRYHVDPARHPDPAVRQLAARAAAARAFVVGTPLYHNSYSGVLKNALDHLNVDHFARKPVALLAHGSGLGAVQACDHLRIVMRGLHALAIPDQVVTTPADFAGAGEAYALCNPHTLERVRRTARALLYLARLLAGGEVRG